MVQEEGLDDQASSFHGLSAVASLKLQAIEEGGLDDSTHPFHVPILMSHCLDTDVALDLAFPGYPSLCVTTLRNPIPDVMIEVVTRWRRVARKINAHPCFRTGPKAEELGYGMALLDHHGWLFIKTHVSPLWTRGGLKHQGLSL